MSELRKSTLTGRWVIIAPERARRPNAYKQYPIPVDDPTTCPFCPGHEPQTPPAVLTYPQTSSGSAASWSVRVVPNRFPALRIEGGLEKRSDGIYDKMQGIGAHEVIVEIPDHQVDMADYSIPQITRVIEAYRDRMSDLLRDSRFRYVLAFKNFGAPAGSTISHAHSQLIALPIVPIQLEREIAGARRYYDFRGRCFFCDSIFQETEDGRRIVAQNEDFLVMAPFASRFPFEMYILPRQHNPYFWTLTRLQTESFAQILRDLLRRFKLALKHPPYSFMIHTSPPDLTQPESFHWHMEIMPKFTEVGGFEWGSGFYINPHPPEDAASYLRDLEQVMDVPEHHLLPTVRVMRNGT